MLEQRSFSALDENVTTEEKPPRSRREQVSKSCVGTAALILSKGESSQHHPQTIHQSGNGPRTFIPETMRVILSPSSSSSTSSSVQTNLVNVPAGIRLPLSAALAHLLNYQPPLYHTPAPTQALVKREFLDPSSTVGQVFLGPINAAKEADDKEHLGAVVRACFRWKGLYLMSRNFFHCARRRFVLSEKIIEESQKFEEAFSSYPKPPSGSEKNILDDDEYI